MPRTPLLLALLLFAVPSAALAQADPQIASLGRLLTQGEAPEQRIQAARLLGDSEDPEALRALCTGLQDASEQVRAAAAQALAKLEEAGGLECLQERQEETDAAAKAAMQSAIESLKKLQARPARFYVSLPEVKDQTGNLSPELVKSTEARIRRKLVRMGAQFAPEKESPAAAQKVLRKLRIQGYRMMVEIRPMAEGGLKLSAVCLRYPGQQLLGNVEVKAEGAEPYELLAALAPALVEEAAATFAMGK
jgi:hypothetical protein